MLRLARYAQISSSRVAETARQLYTDPKAQLYPVVGHFEPRLGSIVLKQPNNRNTLESETVDELYRYLVSFRHDQSIDNVFLDHTGDYFSAGASYLELKSDPYYLDKLVRLSLLWAGFEKPIFAWVSGGVRGIAAYLLNMTSVTILTPKAHLKFNQTSRGFVPICGGSHRLSRIPASIGTYLALTGQRCSQETLARLGLAHAFVKEDEPSSAIRKGLSRANMFFRDGIRIDFNHPGSSQVRDELRVINRKHSLPIHIETIKRQLVHDKSTFLPRDAQLNYQIARIMYENTVDPFNSFSRGRHLEVNNYFSKRRQIPFQFLQDKHILSPVGYGSSILIDMPADKIHFCFGAPTLGQCLRRLKADNSEWAIRTLEKISAKDSLASHLTFSLIQKATTSTWTQAVDMEYKVAKKLIQSSRVELVTTENTSFYRLVSDYSRTPADQIDQTVVDQFMASDLPSLDHDVPKTALYPTTDFANQIPDSARSYLNRQFWFEDNYENEDIQIIRFLESKKIDYRSVAYDPHVLRDHINRKQNALQLLETQKKRILFFQNNNQILDNFIAARKTAISQLNQTELSEKARKMLTQKFNHHFKGRKQSFRQSAKVLGLQKKVSLFKDLRSVLLQKLVYEGVERGRMEEARSQMHHGLIYFDKDKGIFDSENPLIEEILKSQQGLATQLSSLEVNKPLPQSSKPKWEVYFRRSFQQVKRWYGDDIPLQMKAAAYSELINQNSTSEEVAALSGWSVEDLLTTIQNAPLTEEIDLSKSKEMYHQVDLEKLSKLEQALNEVQISFKDVVKQMDQQVDVSLVGGYLSLFSLKFLNKQLQKPFKDVFERVYSYVANIKGEKPFPIFQKELGSLDQWAKEVAASKVSQRLLADTLFIFSYLGILLIKESLSIMEKYKELPRSISLPEFINGKLGMSFNKDSDEKQVRILLMTTLYQFTDLHTLTKSDITLPQSKLVDFFNRIKSKIQTNPRTGMPKSFDVLALLVAKDRYKIYRRIHSELPLSAQPQFHIQAVRKLENSPMLGLKDSMSYRKDRVKAITKQLMLDKKSARLKRLPVGFQYYITHMDAFVHKSLGTESFLPKELVAHDEQIALKEAKKLLNTSQTVEQWVQINLSQAIDELLRLRLSIEPKMTSIQLKAFDQDLEAFLSPSALKGYLFARLSTQVQAAQQLVQQQIQPLLHEDGKYLSALSHVQNRSALQRLNNLFQAHRTYQMHYDTMEARDTTRSEKEDLKFEEMNFFNKRRLSELTIRRMKKEVLRRPSQEELSLGTLTDEDNRIPSAQAKMKAVETELHKLKEILVGEIINHH